MLCTNDAVWQALECRLSGGHLIGRNVCNGSLCRALHSDPYAQVATMYRSCVFVGVGATVVRRLDTKASTELNIVFAVERTGDHTVGDTPCIPHRSRASEADWVRSRPIGLGNEGEGTRLAPAIPANAVTMRSPLWPK